MASALALFAVGASAGPISLGNLSYNVVIPSGVAPGVAAFTIANLTGANEAAPGYPALNEVDFDNASLLVTFAGGATQTLDLGDIAPGFLTDGSNPALDFSLADPIASAQFTALFGATTVTLDSSVGGGTFAIAADGALSLTDPSGSLQDGDNADIVAQPAVIASTVPEPASLWLLLGGSLLLAGYRWWRRASAPW